MESNRPLRTSIPSGTWFYLRQASDEFQFEARRRRPTNDPVDALLSLGYSLFAEVTHE